MSEWTNAGGWIKIHRSLTEHWLAEHPDKLGWWVLLLLKANHEDKKVLVGNNLIELERGQVIASLSFLAELWNTSKRTAERFLLLLEHDKMLSRCTSQKVTIITISNYDSYQEKNAKGCAYVCADDESIGIQSVSETKKEKERKEYYNNTNSAYACEEEDYIARYKKEGMWKDAAMILHKKIPECQNLFEMFIVEYQHNGYTHSDYSDFKRHFIQWARIAVQKEPTIPQPKEKKVISNTEILKMMQG